MAIVEYVEVNDVHQENWIRFRDVDDNELDFIVESLMPLLSHIRPNLYHFEIHHEMTLKDAEGLVAASTMSPRSKIMEFGMLDLDALTFYENIFESMGVDVNKIVHDYDHDKDLIPEDTWDAANYLYKMGFAENAA